MTARVPLAWLFLTKVRGRFFAAVAGIAFAVILSLVELGFETALYASITQLYSHLNADLVLIHPFYQCLVARESIPRRRLFESLGTSGVSSVAPLYMEQLQWTNPLTRRDRFLLVIGVNPADHALTFGVPDHLLARTQEPGIVLFDDASRPEYGPIPDLFHRHGSVVTEISHRRVEVAGLFHLGASFANSGHVLTSDTNFLRLMPLRDPSQIDIGLIRLAPGANLEAARSALAAHLPQDVTVLTKAGLLDRERTYWTHNLPIGFIFRASLILSLLVGAVVVYQILYGNVSEHLAEYATLKAMGYSDRRLFSAILQEALILSITGFLPGVLAGFGVYAVVRHATVIPIQMTAARVATAYALTALMCGLAGVLAARRLRSADPVDNF